MTGSSSLRIGVDLGGTKIEAIALDLDGSERARRRIPTPRDDYKGTVRAIIDLVGGIERELGRTGTLGVGMPGTLSPATGLVKNANSTWLNDRTFDRDVEAALGRPVRFANDANCLAVSEATDGAAAGERVVFACILGTGCGGGLALDGRVHAGPNGTAGEWGHNPLPWPTPKELPGPACYCGRRGCIETWVSGTGLVRDHSANQGAKGSLNRGDYHSAPESLTAEAIVERALSGDPAADASLRRYEDRLARALAHLVNVLDPDVLVLGGGMSNVDRLYESVPALVPRYVFGGEANTPLRRAQHGDSSGVRGAAWLWPPAA
jgi:fructokinase